MKRNWSEAEGKRTEACRYCERTDRPIELAHVIGRTADKRSPVRLLGRNWSTPSTVWVHPDRVVPLCGPFGDPEACHTKYDHHEISLIGYLTLDEEAQAVHDALGLENARIRISPTSYRNKVALEA